MNYNKIFLRLPILVFLIGVLIVFLVSCDVANTDPIESITLEPGNDFYLTLGSSKIITATLTPSSSYYIRRIKWSVSYDPDYTDLVTLSDNNNGTATITAKKTGDGEVLAMVESKIASVRFHVTSP